MINKFVKKFVNIREHTDEWLERGAAAMGIAQTELIRIVLERAELEEPTQIMADLRRIKREAKMRALDEQLEALRRKKQELEREEEPEPA